MAAAGRLGPHLSRQDRASLIARLARRWAGTGSGSRQVTVIGRFPGLEDDPRGLPRKYGFLQAFKMVCLLCAIEAGVVILILIVIEKRRMSGQSARGFCLIAGG
jgi:hypothetical protein